jgi:hypothetical protein
MNFVVDAHIQGDAVVPNVASKDILIRAASGALSWEK